MRNSCAIVLQKCGTMQVVGGNTRMIDSYTTASGLTRCDPLRAVCCGVVGGAHRGKLIIYILEILHIILLTPHKLSKELKNRPGAKSASAW